MADNKVPTNEEYLEKQKKKAEEIAKITNKYKVTVIKNEYTPKVKAMRDVSKYVSDNKDMFNSIGLFLKSPGTQKAAGLAANQIAINGKRLMKNFFLIQQNMLVDSGFDIIFNPEIIEKRGTKLKKYEECLTWENDNVIADRWPFIVVKFQDMNGTIHEGIAVSGFEAQVWQHECDHLNGIEEVLIPKTEKTKDEVVTSGRNDKCPCGSNKKYKKCCLFYDNY